MTNFHNETGEHEGLSDAELERDLQKIYGAGKLAGKEIITPQDRRDILNDIRPQEGKEKALGDIIHKRIKRGVEPRGKGIGSGRRPHAYYDNLNTASDVAETAPVKQTPSVCINHGNESIQTSPVEVYTCAQGWVARQDGKTIVKAEMQADEAIVVYAALHAFREWANDLVLHCDDKAISDRIQGLQGNVIAIGGEHKKIWALIHDEVADREDALVCDWKAAGEPSANVVAHYLKAHKVNEREK